MPRLKQVSRSEATDENVLAAYDRVFGDRDPVAEPGTSTGSPGNWWTTFALAPDLLRQSVRGFGLAASPKRTIDPQLRELGMTRAAWLVGSTFVFSQHCKVLRAHGMAEPKIEAIPFWAVTDVYSPLERRVLAYADCMTCQSGRVPDQVFDALRQHLDDRQMLELTFFIGLYIFHATTVRALRLEFDDRDDSVIEIAAPGGGDEKSILRDLQGER